MTQFNSYPKIHSTNLNEGMTGLYSKTILTPKSFICKQNAVLFLPNKGFSVFGKTNSITDKHKGFLLEILFNGLNYSNKRFSRVRPRFFSDTHRSEIFICHENAANTFKSRVHKRRLLFFSYDINLLYNIEKTIKQFRLPNIYTTKGLYSLNDIYKIKKLKKKK